MPTKTENGVPSTNRYDPRNLQTKALERWERQKRVWDSVRDSLLRDTAQGYPASMSHAMAAAATTGSVRNFDEGTRNARERAEDFGMIESGVPRAALGSNHIWESQLRQDDEKESGTRLVQIGKAIYPYALYGIVKDPAGLKDDNPTYTRMIPEPAPGSTAMPMDDTTRAARSTMTRTAIRFNADANGSRTDAQALADDAALQAMLEDGDTENSYYKQQLELYFPYIQQRFPHFMVPREYLHVDGQPAPLMSAEEMKAQLLSQAERQENADPRGSPGPVQYFPPPQSVRLQSSRPGTGNINNHGSLRLSAAGTPPPQTHMLNSSAAAGSGGISTPPSYATDLLDPYKSRGRPRTDSSGAMGGLDNNEYANSDGVEEEDDAEDDAARAAQARLAAGPTLSLSTREVFFTGDAGELLHGEVAITNTSTMTCYYSWEPVDVFGERLEDHRLVAQYSGRTGTPDGQRMSNSASLSARSLGEDRPMPVPGAADADDAELEVGEALHGMLQQPGASPHAFFRLAKPLNGVILPEETQSFPFSVRPPVPGYHAQTYELLTIPPLPERILVKLTVVATTRTPRARRVARPVAHVVETRVRADEARRVVQELTRDHVVPYEQADLRLAIRRREVSQARKATAEQHKTDRQRAQWTRANSSVLDGLPYNREVYAKMARLHANLAKTLESLGQPLRSGSRPWEGNVVSLLRDLHELRDASSRSVLYEGVLVLLRAARVSRSEEEPLQELLHRAAEATAELVINRALPLANSEAELQQYTHETTAASLANGTGSRRPGSTQKRGVGGGGGGAGTGAAKNGAGNTANGAANESTAPVVGSIRDTLKAPAPTSPADEESYRSELDVLKSLRQAEVMRTSPEVTERCWQAFKEAIDAACDLPLLEVVEATRAQSIAAIQSAPLMDTKASIDVPPPVTKATGRKK